MAGFGLVDEALRADGATAAAPDTAAGPDADSLELHGSWAENTERRIARERKDIPVPAGPVKLALLDLAMPRDVDAAVHRVPGVRLVDIESLAEASADAPMAADVDQVRAIVSDEVAAFGAAQRAAHITPTVVALRAMAAEVVAGEVARLEGRLPDLDDKQRSEVTQTVRRVVDKLLHAPTVRIKQLAAEPGGAGYADALRDSLRPRPGRGGRRLPGRCERRRCQEPRAVMTEKALRLGTRRSKLAMAQSGHVADAVRQLTGRQVELVEITTYGDTSREHLAQIGGTGVFVVALREALLRGEVDFAVHSLKDLPTAQPRGSRAGRRAGPRGPARCAGRP